MKYERLKVQVIEFNQEDVIVASNPIAGMTDSRYNNCGQWQYKGYEDGKCNGNLGWTGHDK